MSHKHWRLRVEHIIQAIDRIEEVVADKTFEQFIGDHVVFSAVLWNFTVMGEAVRHVPDDIKQIHSQIAWSDIRSMRNFLAHVYELIRLEVVWETIHDDLPGLRTQLTTLIENLDGDNGK